MLIAMSGMKEFGQLIKNAREQRGITGVELARRLDKSHSVLVRWERGQVSYPPDPFDIGRLSKELGLSREAMLQALGYIEPEREDAEVITIRADDPRAAMVRLLDGVPNDGVESAVQIIRTIVDALAYGGRQSARIREKNSGEVDSQAG